MGSNPVTVVANSLHRHDQSINLGIYDSNTALQPDWDEVALHHAGNTSVVMFVEEHSLRVLAVHLAKGLYKYHLSDVAGKCTDQSAGHQWHHTTRLWKSDVGSCFQQFLEDYHNPINRSYHIQHMQHLEPADMYSWLELCCWINSNSHTICNILFTDEAHFTRDGVNNTRNSHLWDRDNSHGTVKSNYQHRFSINVWCGVIGDQLTGPYVFPQRLTGVIYANFFQD